MRVDDVEILYKFELYYAGALVGYECHAVDPDLGGLIGIYHKKPTSEMIAGYPVTMGDRFYIMHDEKKLMQ